MESAGLDHAVEFPLQSGDAFLNQPPVSLDLAFTGAPHEAEAAALTFEMCP